MLRVSGRAKQLRLNTAHKIFYKQAPEYLQENFEKARNRQQQHARNRLWNFSVPNVKGNESNSLIFFHAVKDWNSLPDELKTCENIMFFQKRSKETPDTKGSRRGRECICILLGYAG